MAASTNLFLCCRIEVGFAAFACCWKPLRGPNYAFGVYNAGLLIGFRRNKLDAAAPYTTSIKPQRPRKVISDTADNALIAPGDPGAVVDQSQTSGSRWITLMYIMCGGKTIALVY